MMKKIAFLLLPLLSSTASAVMVDLRHEYLDDSKANYDRVYISHRFDNGFGFAVEAKPAQAGMTKRDHSVSSVITAMNIR